MDTEKILKEAHSNGYDLGRKERTKQILELEMQKKDDLFTNKKF